MELNQLETFLSATGALVKKAMNKPNQQNN